MSKRQFLSVNMRRRNAAMHSLLETNTEDDVLFVQEPWFDRIGVERSDHTREGVDVHGGANHPDWELFYPYFTNDKRAKVMTYKRKQVANRITPLKVSTTARSGQTSHDTYYGHFRSQRHDSSR
jgi:hypothetical protein